MSQTVNVKTLYDWNDITFLGAPIEPTYRYPNLNIAYSYMNRDKRDESTSRWYYAAGVIGTCKYTNSSTSAIRPLVTPITGTESSNGTFCWNGIATNYREAIKISFIKRGFVSLDGIDSTEWTNKSFNFTNMFKLNANGVYPNGLTTTQYNPGVAWKAYHSGSWTTNNETGTAWSDFDVQASIALENDSTGKQKNYEHVICHIATNEWKVSCTDYFHTWRSNLNTLTAANLQNVSTKSVDGSYCGGWSGSASGTTWQAMSVGTIDAGFSDSTDKLSVIGMLLNNKKCNEIYQTEKSTMATNGNSQISIPKATLSDGLQLVALEANQNCTWIVQFGDIKAYNTSSSQGTNQNEIEIYMSYVPFSDGINSSNYVQYEGHPTADTYVLTENRKATIKWNNQNTGVIYVKCKPHWTGTSYMDKPWEIKLDLESEQNGRIETIKID